VLFRSDSHEGGQLHKEQPQQSRGEEIERIPSAFLRRSPAHETAERVERAILDSPGVADVQTHLEPLERTLTARPADEDADLRATREVERLVRERTGAELAAGYRSCPTLKTHLALGAVLRGQPGQIAYIIFDASSRHLFMPSLYPAIEAPTIRELAAKFELDPATLEATVETFNAAVRPGTFDFTVLDDCRTEGLMPPKTHWARRIETAPFYGYPVRPGITFTYLGTRVNKEARMLMKDGKPSVNMFAAGEIMAGNVLGKGYTAGVGMTIGTAFGRIAGTRAAAAARKGATLAVA
jgi:hypothetical protein